VATAAVRETSFNMKVQDDGETTLTVMQGTVEFGTAFGTCPIDCHHQLRRPGKAAPSQSQPTSSQLVPGSKGSGK